MNQHGDCNDLTETIFFQDFLLTPKYVFHHSTKDNAKFLYASPFLSFRSLLITPFDCIRRLPILIRFLHLQSMIDYVNNVNIWSWKIARPLQRGTLSVSSSLLRLVGWAEFSMSHNNYLMNIIRPAAINNDIIIKVSPAVRDRWGFTPLVEAHRYELAFIYSPCLNCCFCGTSLTRLAGSNIRMLSDFLLPSWRTSFQRNWRSRHFHNDYYLHHAFNSTIFSSEISQYSMQLVEKIKKGERRQSTVSKEISLSKAKEDGKKKDSEKE